MEKYDFHKDGFAHPYFLKIDFLLHLINSAKYRGTRHFFCLAVLFLCLVVTKTWGKYNGVYDYIDFVFYFLLLAGLIYCNMYLLVPKVLFRGKSFYYFLVFTLFITLSVVTAISFENILIDSKRTAMGLRLRKEITPVVIFANIMWTFVLIFSSTALKFLQQWIKDTDKMIYLKRDAMTSELIALRNQINPHFLFNMLNNINVLAKIGSPRVSPLIEEFSDFLRYLIYDSDQPLVALTTEVSFVKNYLDLETVRRDDFTYQVIFEVAEIENQFIPPNIILILVENAVKHSIDVEGVTFVYVSFRVTADQIIIQVSNSMSKYRRSKETTHGVGLVNLNRRLELLYGGYYQLMLSEKGQVFTADLTLPLTKREFV